MRDNRHKSRLGRIELLQAERFALYLIPYRCIYGEHNERGAEDGKHNSEILKYVAGLVKVEEKYDDLMDIEKPEGLPIEMKDGASNSGTNLL